MSLPTATSMKLKFPEFSDVDDMTIEFAIEEASYGGGDHWTVGYDTAVMYLAAHLISAGKAAADEMSGDSSGAIQSESIGRMSISYKKDDRYSSNSSAMVDELASSSYGRRYIEIRGMNFGGPVVV